VALSLLGVALIAMVLFTTRADGLVLATTTWGSSNSWPWPRCRCSSGWRDPVSLSPVGGHVRRPRSLAQPPAGRLLHVNVLGCGIFAAVSGSSAATAATIGKMSIPELDRHGYPPIMSIGTLAARERWACSFRPPSS
jgi:hypothetical protein